MRLRVHPLFVVLAVVLIVLGRAQFFLWTFLAVSLHELGHAVAARARGYLIKSLEVLPFGAVMCSEDSFDPISSVIVGLAGPLANLFLALITLGLWWIFPAAYTFTRPFLYANLSLATFNLLPVYPLDGSRVVLGFAKNRLRAIKGLRVAGVTVSLLFFALFIASAFFELNLTLGIVAVFLFYGATSGVEEEAYVSVFSAGIKDFSCGVEVRRIKIGEDVPIVRLFRFAGRREEVLFEIVNTEGESLCLLTEHQLRTAAVQTKLTAPVKTICHLHGESRN